MKNIYAGRIIYTFFTGLALMLFGGIQAQTIHLEHFDSSAITHPYNGDPAVFNTNLSNPVWTNSTGAFVSFGGATNQALSLNNSGGTPTITLTFQVAAGYQLSVTQFNFWRQRSPSGAQFWSMAINGTNVGNGTVPQTGAFVGLTSVSTPVNGLTGTISVVLTLSGASGTGTFRLDDFQLNGSVTPAPTLAVGTLTAFGDVCRNTTAGANTFTLTGSALTGANVVIGSLAGYTFSANNGTFATSLTLVNGGGAGYTYSGGNLNATIYVRFTPTLVQSYNGNISVSGGGASTKTVAVTGSGVNTPADVSTATASAITSNSVTLSAIINSIGCSAVTTYGFEYSTNPVFGNGTGTFVSSTNLSGGNFSANVTGLSPNTTYYVHVIATNSGGTTYSTTISFTTLSLTPTLSVPNAGAGSLASFGNICINTNSINSFDLTGSVLNNSNISIAALSGYLFSVNSSGPFTNTLTLVNGGSGYTYSGGNLSATIYVQFLPTAVQSYNGNITISGGGAPNESVSVTGSGINSLPNVTTENALFITESEATLPGTVVSAGCGATIEYGIEYSTTSGFAPGTGTQVTASNLSGGTFSVNLSGLTPGATYYYYAYYISGAGTDYGLIKSFTTIAPATKLVIISVSPVSPTELTPFSIVVEAQNNAGIPVEVTQNTSINITKIVGLNTLTAQSTPAGVIPSGSSFTTITGLTYSAAENGVGIQATAVAGMTLAASPMFSFNVIAYSGPADFIWSQAGASNTFFNGANWQSGTQPGAPSIASSKRFDVARFTSLAPASSAGNIGLNMNSLGAPNAYYLGTLYGAEDYNYVHTGNLVYFGNNSTASGTLHLLGNALTNVGGITGNNFSNLMIANYIGASSTTKTMEIRNIQGSGTQNLTLNLYNSGTFAVGLNRILNINVLMTGSQTLTIAGGGTVSLQPSGAGSVNTFSGAINIADGILSAGNSGAVNGNILTLGSGTTAGRFKINGNNITINGVSTSGTAGNLNVLENGSSTAATLTINNSSGNLFSGKISDGSTGAMLITKNGAGVFQLTGGNDYTGLTTVNAGTFQLNKSGGGTVPSGNSFTVTGGILQISSTQTIKDLTLTGGTLRVDAGVTLTITENYTAGTCNIINLGTIIMQGTALQTFPGTAASVISMNNLTINTVFGVNMNNSLNVAGTLHLPNGTFTIGGNTLTLNNPITGTPNKLAANNTSSIIIAGTAAGVNVPSSVAQLNNLTVSNSQGTTLQGALNIAGLLFITSTSGTVNAGTNTFNGNGNVTMAGGTLLLSKNGVMQPELLGAYNITGGTVVFNGDGTGAAAQTIRPVNYYNVTSTSTGDRILANYGVIGIANNFLPSTNNYTTTGSTVDFNGPRNQSLQAFNFYNLTLSGGVFSKQLQGNISVKAEMAFGTGTTFQLAAYDVTLKSDATGTANVGKINAPNSINYGALGRFIVERYIPAHNKAWQFMAVPTTARTILLDWQENNVGVASNIAPGYGVNIVSDKPGAVTRGWDFYAPLNSTMKTYVAATDSWLSADDGVTNTSAKPLYNQKGYMLFVRGDRSITSGSVQASNATTLRTKGKLFAPGAVQAPEPPSTNVGANLFESVGNPYASAINFGQVTRIGSVQNTFYVWDPSLGGAYGLGGWQTLVDSSGFYIPVVGGTSKYPLHVPVYIQSGQAFLVHALAGGGTVSFTENAKVSGSKNLFRPSPGGSAPVSFRGTLYSAVNGANDLLDGNVVHFNNNNNSLLDANDIVKMMNSRENFGISRLGNLLTMEARKTVGRNDTIFYHLSDLKKQSYKFVFTAANFNSRVNAWLVDTYTGTRTSLDITGVSAYEFVVNNEAESASSNRFYIVFRDSQAPRETNELITSNENEPAITKSLNIYPNPVVERELSFAVEGLRGMYSLQVVNTFGQVAYQSRNLIEKGAINKVKLPGSLAAGTYRLVLNNGSKQISASFIIP